MLLATLLLLAQDAGDPGKCENKVAATPWIERERDYPADARADGIEGRVGYMVDVDAEGCASACRITSSSGISSLDDATCALIMRNARFKPARAADGTRIASSYSYSQFWFLPEPLADDATRAEPVNQTNWVTDFDYPAAALRAAEEGQAVFTLDLDAQGVPTACAIVLGSGSLLLDDATCRLMLRRARFKPARDAKGEAMASRWKSVFTWSIPR